MEKFFVTQCEECFSIYVTEEEPLEECNYEFCEASDNGMANIEYEPVLGCPVCKGKPTIEQYEKNITLIFCDNSNCPFDEISAYGDTFEEAIKNWNNRA